MDSLDNLDRILREADRAHAEDVSSLAGLDDGQIAYLAGAGDLEDPVTDGIEARCPT